MVKVRRATPSDDLDFARLLLLSAPYFPIIFGSRIEMTLTWVFRCKCNLFSFEHVYFAEAEGKNAGMILGYSWEDKKRENFRTGILLFARTGLSMLANVPTFLRLNATTGKMGKFQYYISNVAVYSQFRRRGIGGQLMSAAEYEARKLGARNVILDVERENLAAIGLYERMGYKMVEEFSVPLGIEKNLHFIRMDKEI